MYGIQREADFIFILKTTTAGLKITKAIIVNVGALAEVIFNPDHINVFDFYITINVDQSSQPAVLRKSDLCKNFTNHSFFLHGVC